MLVKIAEIGDTKGRNDPLFDATKLRLDCGGDEAKMWAKWRADLEAMEQGRDDAPPGIDLPHAGEDEDTNL
jgi:hypothetical protein